MAVRNVHAQKAFFVIIIVIGILLACETKYCLNESKIVSRMIMEFLT